jgi:hypothetical protein
MQTTARMLSSMGVKIHANLAALPMIASRMKAKQNGIEREEDGSRRMR